MDPNGSANKKLLLSEVLLKRLNAATSHVCLYLVSLSFRLTQNPTIETLLRETNQGITGNTITTISISAYAYAQAVDGKQA